MRRRKHVGALGHEVHAAEDDELRFGVFRDLAGEAERVADVVGELDHLVALIVMAEDDERGCRAPPSRRRCGDRAPRRTSRDSARGAAGAPRYGISRTPSGQESS